MKRGEKKKYFISSRTAFWVTVSFTFVLLLYVILTFLINLPPSVFGSTTEENSLLLPTLTSIRDVVLVVLSILGTCFFTAWIIEVRSRNEMYDSHLSNDILGNPEIYRNMDESTQKEMLSILENILLFRDKPHLSGMYENIKEKFITLSSEEYYYDDCRYTVNCTITQEGILKSITRTIRIKSYDASCKISSIPLVTWSGSKLSGNVVPFKFSSATLDGKAIEQDKIGIIEKTPDQVVSVNSGYDLKYTYFYKPELELFDDKIRTISVSYNTVVPLDDIVYTCRANVPCRSFTVDFRVCAPDNYKVLARAFGFFDSAVHSPIVEDDRQISVSFNDWIFPQDGVVITFAPKSAAD